MWYNVDMKKTVMIVGVVVIGAVFFVAQVKALEISSERKNAIVTR